jgi:hypothetical protein
MPTTVPDRWCVPGIQPQQNLQYASVHDPMLPATGSALGQETLCMVASLASDDSGSPVSSMNPIPSTMQLLRRRFRHRPPSQVCALIMAVFVLPVARAIDDVPMGALRWVQGFDGNQPTSGFRVDGTLRIEAPDEPQPVGIPLESGRIEVGPEGRILVHYGPGGSRFIQGDVVNEGLVALRSVLLFSRDGAEWVNRGTIEAASYMGLGVIGKGARFRQVSGEIRVADPTSRLEFYNQSAFIYEGGRVLARPVLVGASARVDATATEGLSLRFLGLGCRLEGRYPSDLSTSVASDDTFGPADLRLDPSGAIGGTLELSATRGDPGVILGIPETGATLSADGLLKILPGAGVCEIQGPLANEGRLLVDGPTRWRSAEGRLRLDGRILVGEEGCLSLTVPSVQLAGTLEIDGGALEVPTGLTISGGTLVAAGELSGRITNAAVAVVDQARPVRMRGDWTQTASGTMRAVARFGPAATGVALNVEGALKLGGALEVVAAGGSRLADGTELRLLQANALKGWFEKLVLPPLQDGLHWQWVPMDREVRLKVRSSPTPLVIDWLRRDGSDVLRVSGPLLGRQQVLLQVSQDLRHWTPFQRIFPFNGLAMVPVPKEAMAENSAMTVYQAVLGPLGPPE